MRSLHSAVVSGGTQHEAEDWVWLKYVERHSLNIVGLAPNCDVRLASFCKLLLSLFCKRMQMNKVTFLWQACFSCWRLTQKRQSKQKFFNRMLLSFKLQNAIRILELQSTCSGAISISPSCLTLSQNLLLELFAYFFVFRLQFFLAFVQ